MKVLVICSQYPPLPSPEAAHSLLLCENLSRLGVDVHLLTNTLPPDHPAPIGFHLHPVMNGWGWKSAQRLFKWVNSIKPDVVLLVYLGWIYLDHPMVTFMPTLLRLFGRKTAFVVQFENSLGAKRQRRKSRLVWRVVSSLAKGRRHVEERFGSLLTESHQVIALSEIHLDELARVFPAVRDRAHVLPAPPLIRFRRENVAGEVRRAGRAGLGLSADDENVVVFGYFGYIYPTKGLEQLLPAFQIAEQRLQKEYGVASRLAVVGGPGDGFLQERLRKEASDLGLADKVVWTGHCPPMEEKASTLLQGIDVAVLPFDAGVRLNNSSFAVCATHGLPIVTTRGETIESAFEDKINVSLATPKSPSSIAEHMVQMGASPERRAQFGAAARELAKTHFSWERALTATLEVLRSAIHAKNNGTR